MKTNLRTATQNAGTILLKFSSIFLFTCCVFKLSAQDTGMHFIENKSWQAILQQAKAEKKFIFVDCYTTWCGPCKQMSAQVFPLQNVGTFYNANFLNVKFQLDTTTKDKDAIKARYGDATAVRLKYAVQVYPTYLFVNPEGELVHREIGSSGADEFIAKGRNALNPETQYYTQVKKYEAGQRDPVFLKKLVTLAGDAYDQKAISVYSKAYFATGADLLDSSNLRFVVEVTRSTSDTGFALMMKHRQKFETIIDKQELDQLLRSIVIRSEYEKNDKDFAKWDDATWTKYEMNLGKQYPAYAADVILVTKSNTCLSKKDWVGYTKVIDHHLASHPIAPEALNNYAWNLFTNCDNKECLESALSWSKQSFTNVEKQEPGYMDTYANILYKLDRKKEALEWELKAQEVAVAGGADKSWGQDVIDKINKGEKTW